MAAVESSIAASRALDDLYRQHAAEVYRYAYAVLGNHADAEDVTQTTFVNALRALERGERPRKPSNWLITITHNIVRQRYRQQHARPAEVELDRDVAQQPADESGPSLEELVKALQRIPQSQREALVMRELEGRPYKEIAEILELSTGALETLLFRARRSLADELANQVTCSSAELGLSKQLDQRLSRKERKRLDDHIAECPSCARLRVTQGKQRRAFKGLALLPLPLSLTLFKGAPSASAAIGLPTIGAAGTAATVGTAAAVGGGAAAGGGGITLGGLVLGGVAVKAAAVVAAVSVAGGVGYVGTKEVGNHRSPPAKAPVTAVVPTKSAKPRPAAVGGAERSASTTSNGKALAKGSARAASPTGSSRGATAPGQTGAAPGLTKETPERSTKAPATSGKSKPANEKGKGGDGAVRAADPAAKPSPAKISPAMNAKPTSPQPKATGTQKNVKPTPDKSPPTSAARAVPAGKKPTTVPTGAPPASERPATAKAEPPATTGSGEPANGNAHGNGSKAPGSP